MAGNEQRIQTTVVGSYPVPDWLGTAPSEDRIIDATRVILHTQENLGIDLVCDGEVYRYDLGHPETNGMIEYFLRPMAGIRNSFTFDELVRFETDQMGWRKEPAGVVEGPIDGLSGYFGPDAARSKCFINDQQAACAVYRFEYGVGIEGRSGSRVDDLYGYPLGRE